MVVLDFYDGVTSAIIRTAEDEFLKVRAVSRNEYVNDAEMILYEATIAEVNDSNLDKLNQLITGSMSLTDEELADLNVDFQAGNSYMFKSFPLRKGDNLITLYPAGYECQLES